MPALSRWGSLSSRWNSLFRDHELIVRTDGHVRFLRLSAGVQRKAAVVALSGVFVWLAGTASLLGWQAWTSWQNRDFEQRASAVQLAEARIAEERRSVEQIASSLDSRQDQLETLFKAHFGDPPENEAEAKAAPAPAAGAPAGHPAGQGAGQGAGTPAAKPSAATSASRPDQLTRLRESAVRQEQMIASLTQGAAERTQRAEQALLSFGIQSGNRQAQGGPFLPWRGAATRVKLDPGLRKLALVLQRMEEVEALLMAVPSARPAEGMSLTSAFGYRFDPFNGQRAMHAGLDFRGAHDSPIRAAAPGRVSFVGVKSGYGNVVEVDHGHGIQTRYAHLSGFNSRIGQAVQSGEAIARMGSTGRSTGTHLHFEVRVNGTAVNPRRFLEANPHVLEVKAEARSRVLARVAAG